MLVDDVTTNLTRLRSFAVFAHHSALRALGAVGTHIEAEYVVQTRLMGDAQKTSLFGFTMLEVKTGRVLASERLPFGILHFSDDHLHLAMSVAMAISGALERDALAGPELGGNNSAYAAFLPSRARQISPL